jgi:hypothetical protein
MVANATGTAIRWRHALLGALIVIVLLIVTCVTTLRAGKTKHEADGWQLLFDGKSLENWDCQGTIQVEDGAIVMHGPAELWSRSSWKDCEISFEYACSSTAAADAADFMFRRTQRGDPGLDAPMPTFKAKAWNSGTLRTTVGSDVLTLTPAVFPFLADTSTTSCPVQFKPVKIGFGVKSTNQCLLLRNVRVRPITP